MYSNRLRIKTFVENIEKILYNYSIFLLRTAIVAQNYSWLNESFYKQT